MSSAVAPRVGISGFDRIGRLVLRCALVKGTVDIVAINEPHMELELMVYLLKYDTVHGPYKGTIAAGEDHLIVDDHIIKVYSKEEPSEIPWADAGAHYVISTGDLATAKGARAHLAGGATKVIITAPSDEVPMVVLGVNEDTYDSSMNIISNASCTTQCLAPIAKVIHDEFGLEEGLVTTIHAFTSTQNTVDGPSHKGWRRGRHAGQNIIPSLTGASRSIGKVIPALEGRVAGMAFRVPSVDVSVVDLTCRLTRETSYEEIKAAMKRASESGPLRDYLGYTDDLVVSSDMIGDHRSAIFDANAGVALSSTFFKIIAWYDHMWGYACRAVDLASYMNRHSGSCNIV